MSTEDLHYCECQTCRERLVGIKHLRIDRDKWHHVAMEAGAITCVGGGHIYPLKDEVKQLRALVEVESAAGSPAMRTALTSIATMDAFTREGEKPPHEVMRETAKAALDGDKSDPLDLAIAALGRANVGSCTCHVKSDHPYFHAGDCAFRLIEKAVQATRHARDMRRPSLTSTVGEGK